MKNTTVKFYLNKNVIWFCFKYFNKIILFFLEIEFRESGVIDKNTVAFVSLVNKLV